MLLFYVRRKKQNRDICSNDERLLKSLLQNTRMAGPCGSTQKKLNE